MRLQDISYYARGYTSEGIKIFPLAPRGKVPVTSHGCLDASADPTEWEPQWDAGCNIGVATGGVVDVVDCDSVGCLVEFARRLAPEGEAVGSPEEAADLVERLLGPVVWTGRGAHCWVQASTEHTNRAHLIQLADGWVDYRTHGGYVVAPPSVHPSGAVYRFHSAYFTPKQPAPEWLWEGVREHHPEEASHPIQVSADLGETPESYYEAALRANLDRLAQAPEGTRNHTLNQAAFNLGQIASNDAQASRAESELHDMARAIGLTETETIKSIRSGMTAGAANAKRPQPDVTVQANIKSTYRQTEDGAEITVQTEGKARSAKKPTLADYAATIIASYPGLLGYDLFAQRIKKLRDQPGEPESRHGCDRWEDIDQAVLAHNISLELGRDVAAETLAQAVQLAAHAAEHHPVRDYLQRCRAEWDHQSRIRGFLRALGAQETKAHRLELALWLAGAAARGMRDEPVKLDSMLILEGPQGTGKSTVVKILGGEWAMDTPLDMDQPREAYMMLSGSWICEWPELTSFVKTAPEKLKAFLSKEFDDFRLPYGRNMTHLVRHCAFIGTTNDDMYLRDDTGNRRFWPIKCGRAFFNLNWLRQHRDMIWGEAVALCEAYTERGTGFAPAPGTESEILAAQVQTRQQIDELADQMVATVQDIWDKAWSRSDGVFVTLDQLQRIAAYKDFRKNTLKRALESIGGVFTRKFINQTVDYSSGEGKVIPAPKERVRGCQFDRRPCFAADYNDSDFGGIDIPTER